MSENKVLVALLTIVIIAAIGCFCTICVLAVASASFGNRVAKWNEKHMEMSSSSSKPTDNNSTESSSKSSSSEMSAKSNLKVGDECFTIASGNYIPGKILVSGSTEDSMQCGHTGYCNIDGRRISDLPKYKGMIEYYGKCSAYKKEGETCSYIKGASSYEGNCERGSGLICEQRSTKQNSTFNETEIIGVCAKKN